MLFRSPLRSQSGRESVPLAVAQTQIEAVWASAKELPNVQKFRVLRAEVHDWTGKPDDVAADLEGLTSFAGIGVEKREMLDGVKMYINDGAGGTGWLLVRPSGTEPLLRVYCEASSEALVHRALTETEKLIHAL